MKSSGSEHRYVRLRTYFQYCGNKLKTSFLEHKIENKELIPL